MAAQVAGVRCNRLPVVLEQQAKATLGLRAGREL
jgi:hypothetical protein